MDRYIAREGFTGTGNLVVRRAVLAAVGPFAGVAWPRTATGASAPRREGYASAMCRGCGSITRPAPSLPSSARKWDRQTAHDYVKARAARPAALGGQGPGHGALAAGRTAAPCRVGPHRGPAQPRAGLCRAAADQALSCRSDAAASGRGRSELILDTVEPRQVVKFQEVGHRGALPQAEYLETGTGAQDLPLSAAQAAHHPTQPGLGDGNHLPPDAERFSVARVVAGDQRKWVDSRTRLAEGDDRRIVCHRRIVSGGSGRLRNRRPNMISILLRRL